MAEIKRYYTVGSTKKYRDEYDRIFKNNKTEPESRISTCESCIKLLERLNALERDNVELKSQISSLLFEINNLKLQIN